MMVKAFLVMVFLKLNSVRSLARSLEKNRELRLACGFEEQTPSYRTFTRRFKTLDHPAISFAREIIRVLVKHRLINLRIVATDASLLQAKGKPSQRKNPKVKPSDSDAAWGWSQSKDWVFGYKFHQTSTVLVKENGQTLVPLNWEVSSANHHDTRLFLPLMVKTKSLADTCSRKIKYSLADKGYDYEKNYQNCKELGFRFITPVRELKNKKGNPLKLSKIKRSVKRFLKTPKGRKLYYRRADTERLIGHLKDLFLIDPLPVMRSSNVKPYLTLVSLAYLLAVLYNHLNGRSLRAIKSLVA